MVYLMLDNLSSKISKGLYSFLKIFIQNEKGMEKILTSGELLEQCSVGVKE